MANVSQTKEYIAPAARVYAAILGAALTALALDGGLIVSFMVGHVISQALEGRLPSPLSLALTVIVSSASMLGGCAFWGVAMARLARIQVSKRAAWAGILGFLPITVLLALGLQTAEPIVFRINLPLHRLFTLLFVPSAGLIAGTSSLALGWALGWGRAAPALALRVGITAALAFLAVNLGMEALGWQIGGPGAAERATMLTVLFVSNLGAGLAGGAMLGMTLTQRH
jgi:hypothetical protein